MENQQTQGLGVRAPLLMALVLISAVWGAREDYTFGPFRIAPLIVEEFSDVTEMQMYLFATTY